MCWCSWCVWNNSVKVGVSSVFSWLDLGEILNRMSLPKRCHCWGTGVRCVSEDTVTVCTLQVVKRLVGIKQVSVLQLLSTSKLYRYFLPLKSNPEVLVSVVLVLILLCLFFPSCGTKDWTQHLTHPRQALYSWAMAPSILLTLHWISRCGYINSVSECRGVAHLSLKMKSVVGAGEMAQWLLLLQRTQIQFPAARLDGSQALGDPGLLVLRHLHSGAHPHIVKNHKNESGWCGGVCF